VGLGRAAVVSQGRVEDARQGGRCAVGCGVVVAQAGREAEVGLGIALAAVAEDVEGVGQDCAAKIVDFDFVAAAAEVLRIGRVVAGDDAVGHGQRAAGVVDAAAAAEVCGSGRVAGEGAVGHGQRSAAVVDAAAAFGGRVAGEGAVGHGQPAAVVCDAAAHAVVGRVAGEGAVRHGQHGSGAVVVDAAAPTGRVIGEGAVRDGQRTEVVEDAAAVAPAVRRVAGEGAVRHGQRAAAVVDAAAAAEVGSLVAGEGAVRHGQCAAVVEDAATAGKVGRNRVAGEGAVPHGQRAAVVEDAAAVSGCGARAIAATVADGDAVQRQIAGRGHLQDAVGGGVRGGVRLDDRVSRAIAGDRHFTGDDRELAADQGDGVIGGEGDEVGAGPRGTLADGSTGGRVAVGGSDRLTQGAEAVVSHRVGVAVDDDAYRGTGPGGNYHGQHHCQGEDDAKFVLNILKPIHTFLLTIHRVYFKNA